MSRVQERFTEAKNFMWQRAFSLYTHVAIRPYEAEESPLHSNSISEQDLRKTIIAVLSGNERRTPTAATTREKATAILHIDNSFPDNGR